MCVCVCVCVFSIYFIFPLATVFSASLYELLVGSSYVTGGNQRPFDRGAPGNSEAGNHFRNSPISTRMTARQVVTLTIEAHFKDIVCVLSDLFFFVTFIFLQCVFHLFTSLLSVRRCDIPGVRIIGKTTEGS